MLRSYRASFVFLLKENFFYKLDFYYSRPQLEVFRIVIAAFAIVNFGTMFLDYDVLLAPNGLISWEVTNANSFWFEMHPQKIAEFLQVSPDVVMLTLSSIYGYSLVLLLLGIWPNVAAFVSLICYTMITDVITPYAYGMDVYQSVFLFFLCFFPVGYGFSLIRKHPKENLKVVQQLSVRALQIYLIITYLSAGFEKAVMSGWWNGKFIFFLVNDPTIVTSSLIPKDEGAWLYMFFGLTVILAESLYFILIWIKGLRLWIFLAVISIHIFIALFMDLFFFGVLLTLVNIVCWYPAILSDLKSFRKR